MFDFIKIIATYIRDKLSFRSMQEASRVVLTFFFLLSSRYIAKCAQAIIGKTSCKTKS